MRRPLGKRAEDIGSWYAILQMLTWLSVVTNVRTTNYIFLYSLNIFMLKNKDCIDLKVV